jgi:hypothetical protein
MTEHYTCPACGYPHLDEPPYPEGGSPSYDYCPSCGFQFGWTDEDQSMTHAAWRRRWVVRGMPWTLKRIQPPAGWDPERQLATFLEATPEAPCDCCPVCAYPDLFVSRLPDGVTYGSCASCGNYLPDLPNLPAARAAELRQRWIARGMPWSKPRMGAPQGWDPVLQLHTLPPGCRSSARAMPNAGDE